MHTHPGGWAASLARETHPVDLCQGPQPPLLQHMLHLLRLCALPCGWTALPLACARSCGPSRSPRSLLRGSGVLRLLRCCVAAQLVVCNGILCIRWQSAVAIRAASRVQSAVSVAFSPHVAPSVPLRTHLVTLGERVAACSNSGESPKILVDGSINRQWYPLWIPHLGGPRS